VLNGRVDLGAFEFVPRTLSVSQDGSDVIVQDIVGRNNALTISSDGTNLIITDAAEGFVSDLAPFLSNGGRTFSFPIGNITGNLRILTRGGTDSATVGGLPGLLAGLSFDDEPANQIDSITFTGPIDLASDKNLTVFASGPINFVGPDADITARGTGIINLFTSRNVLVESGASLNSVSGDIRVIANLLIPPATGDFDGVVVNGSIKSVDGRISLTGTGGTAAGGFNLGVVIANGGLVENVVGDIALNGTGGSVGASNQGVVIDAFGGNGSHVTSVSGTITLFGVSGNDFGSLNIGVNILNGAVIFSPFGRVNIFGFAVPVGDSNFGVQIVGAGTQVSGSTIDIGARSESGASFFVANGARVTSIEPQGIQILTNRTISLASTQDVPFPLDAGGGSVKIASSTVPPKMTLGTDDTANALGLTDATLDLIRAGTLEIGDPGPNNFPPPPSDITVTGVIDPANVTNLRINGLALRDNFNRPDAPNLSRVWTVQTGSFAVTNGQALATGLSLATVAGLSEADVAIQASVTMTAPKRAGMLVARYQGSGDKRRYAAGLKQLGTQIFAQIFFHDGVKWITLATTLVRTNRGVVRFEALGPSLKLYLNGVLVANAIDNRLKVGGAGLCKAGVGGGVTYDDVSVERIVRAPTAVPFTDAFNPTPNGQLSTAWLNLLGNVRIVGGRAIGGGASSLAMLGAFTPQANVTAAADVTVGRNQSAAVLGRVSANGRTFYQATLQNKNGARSLQLVRVINGVSRVLRQVSVGVSAGRLELALNGTALTLRLGGVERITLQDTAIQAAGSVGISGGGPAAWDNFSVV
jgi:hypothetical protein